MYLLCGGIAVGPNVVRVQLRRNVEAPLVQPGVEFQESDLSRGHGGTDIDHRRQVATSKVLIAKCKKNVTHQIKRGPTTEREYKKISKSVVYTNQNAQRS
jgi:hypothetical protein